MTASSGQRTELRLTAVEVEGCRVYDVDGVDKLVEHRIEALRAGVNVALQELSDQVNAIVAGLQQQQVPRGESPKVHTVIHGDDGRITKLVSMPAEIVR